MKLNFLVPEDAGEKLKMLADAHGFSISEELRVAFDAHLETHKSTLAKMQKMRKDIKQP